MMCNILSFSMYTVSVGCTHVNHLTLAKFSNTYKNTVLQRLLCKVGSHPAETKREEQSSQSGQAYKLNLSVCFSTLNLNLPILKAIYLCFQLHNKSIAGDKQSKLQLIE